MLIGVLDGTGFYGSVFVYSLLFAMVASHALIFYNLWRKGRLDMNEGPKYQMMEEEESPVSRS